MLPLSQAFIVTCHIPLLETDLRKAGLCLTRMHTGRVQVWPECGRLPFGRLDFLPPLPAQLRPDSGLHHTPIREGHGTGARLQFTCAHVSISHLLTASTSVSRSMDHRPPAVAGRFLGPTPTESESLGQGQIPGNVPGLGCRPLLRNILWPSMYLQNPQLFRHLDLRPLYRSGL